MGNETFTSEWTITPTNIVPLAANTLLIETQIPSRNPAKFGAISKKTIAWPLHAKLRNVTPNIYIIMATFSCVVQARTIRPAAAPKLAGNKNNII